MIKNAQKLPMKAHSTSKPMTFGEFVAGVYRTWGKRRAKGIIQLSVAVNLLEFCGTKRFVIS